MKLSPVERKPVLRTLGLCPARWASEWRFPMPCNGPSSSPSRADYRPLDRERRAKWRWLVGHARRNRRLSFAAAAVGQVFHDMHGQDGRIFPTHAALAAKAGLSVRAVRYALRALEGLGLIEWTRRAIGRGRQRRQTSSAYRLLLAGLDALDSLPRLPRRPRALRGCKFCRQKPSLLNSSSETAVFGQAAALLAECPPAESALQIARRRAAERNASWQASRAALALLGRG